MTDPDPTPKPPSAVTGAGTCRSCSAPIVWVTSATSGKAIPCDPSPVEIVETLHVLTGRRAGKTRHAAAASHVTGVTEDGRVLSGHRVDSEIGRQLLAGVQQIATNLFGDQGKAPTVLVRVSHFATCPFAGQHRGRT